MGNLLLLYRRRSVILAGCYCLTSPATRLTAGFQVSVCRARSTSKARPRGLSEATASNHFEFSQPVTPDRCAACRRNLQKFSGISCRGPGGGAKIVGPNTACSTRGGTDPKRAPRCRHCSRSQDVGPVGAATEKGWQQPPSYGAISDGFICGRGSWGRQGNLIRCWRPPKAMAKQDFGRNNHLFAFGPRRGSRLAHRRRQGHRRIVGIARRPARVRAR